MNYKRIIVFLTIATITGCVSFRDNLSGEPMWFPLGATFRLCHPTTILGGVKEKESPVYDHIVSTTHHAYHRLPVQKAVLSIDDNPLWFGHSQQPKLLEDVPLSEQGVSLNLQINPTTNGLLRFVLTIKATDRDVWRELMHRGTDVTPFLFAFFADGTAIHPKKQTAGGGFGGMRSMIKLAEKGKSHIWELSVDPMSILPLLPDCKFKELSVVAAFSEYQHDTFFDEEFDHLNYSKPTYSEGFTGPAIVIRSNIVNIEFDSQNWKAQKDH